MIKEENIWVGKEYLVKVNKKRDALIVVYAIGTTKNPILIYDKSRSFYQTLNSKKRARSIIMCYKSCKILEKQTCDKS